MTIIRVDRSRGRWESIPVALIEDRRLSRGAVGAAVWLLARRDGFQVRMAALPRLLSGEAELVGREKLRRWMRELEAGGYVRRTRDRHDDGRWSWAFVFMAEPIDGFPVDGSAVDGQAVVGSTADGQGVDRRQTPISTRPELHQTTTTTEPVVVVGLDDAALAGYRDSVVELLSSCPSERHQSVVDEVLGLSAKRLIRTDPATVVRALVRAVSNGTFRPRAGVAVTAAREREQLERARRAAEREEEQRRDTPEAREASRRARDEALAKLGRRPARSPFPSVVVASDGRGR
jgi:hypothetical protein